MYAARHLAAITQRLEHGDRGRRSSQRGSPVAGTTQHRRAIAERGTQSADHRLAPRREGLGVRLERFERSVDDRKLARILVEERRAVDGGQPTREPQRPLVLRRSLAVSAERSGPPRGKRREPEDCAGIARQLRVVGADRGVGSSSLDQAGQDAAMETRRRQPG